MISPSETFALMRGVAEAAGYRVDTRDQPDGSLRVVLVSPSEAKPALDRPLLAEEVEVSRGVPGLMVESPLLSVLFGTFQRRVQLQRAVESVRASAAGVSFEIVVCDGGSDDGSREWLAAQPDVVLVGKRSLDGAVDAFNHGYRLCRGRYVANFNDDAIFQARALAEAVARMEAESEIGQGIFAFRGEGEDYGINQIYEGRAGTEYANFGVTRREALEQVVAITGGFWNPIYRTYAADCEQSAWIHRLGWRVARFEDLRVVDIRTKDDLRAKNESRQAGETKLMYYRWPAESFSPLGPPPRVESEALARFEEVRSRTPRPASAPRSTASVYAEVVGFPLPMEEDRVLRQGLALRSLDPVEGKFPAAVDRLPEERVLYVSLAHAGDPQAGLERALRKLGSGGFEEVRWYERYGNDHAGRQEAIVEAAARFKPTLVFMQLQAPNVVDVETVKRVREASLGVTVVTWCGDIADVNSPFKAEWQVFGRACDITLHSSLSHVHVLRSLGVHNAAYLQIGYDEEQYRPLREAQRKHLGSDVAFEAIDKIQTITYDFDACFLGSRYDVDAFTTSLKWHDARLRNDAVLAMAEAFGDRFGLFGRGWGRVEQVVPLAQAHEVYWRSKIGLNVSLANYLECYSSDRLFRIMGCGALALTKSFPMMSVLGLKHGVNALIWNTPTEAVDLARRALAEPVQLAEMAVAGARLARGRHTWDHRMLELFALVEAVRGGR